MCLHVDFWYLNEIDLEDVHSLPQGVCLTLLYAQANQRWRRVAVQGYIIETEVHVSIVCLRGGDREFPGSKKTKNLYVRPPIV